MLFLTFVCPFALFVAPFDWHLCFCVTNNMRPTALTDTDPTTQLKSPSSRKGKAGGHNKRASIVVGLENSLEEFLHDVEHEEEVDTTAEFHDESPAYSILIKILSSFLQLNSMAVRVVCLSQTENQSHCSRAGRLIEFVVGELEGEIELT